MDRLLVVPLDLTDLVSADEVDGGLFEVRVWYPDAGYVVVALDREKEAARLAAGIRGVLQSWEYSGR
jgi:hypothetical protein